MKYAFSKVLLMVCAFTFSFIAVGQETPLDNQDLFNDFTYRQGNVYRTASGKPGPQYWQNEADYKIEATLDDKNNTITGKVVLNYTNNSPETLEFIWMHLEQNRFFANSRGSLTMPLQGGRYEGDTDGGYTISNVQAKENKGGTRYIITDTRMQVFFEEPLKAHGGSAEVSMNFTFKIPEKGMDRMGRLDVKDGTIYSLAQWYPRVAVFDDVVGWNTEPYLQAGEFYLEYGDYDYKITAPYNHVVVASGTLQNAKEVLTKEQLNRWEQAHKSDKTVYIITPSEVGTASSYPKTSGTRTWHYKMENARDIAFGSSSSFIWDAAKIDLPSGKKALAQSAYPKESDGADAWSRSTEYSKASIEFYSKTYFAYPYGSAVNVASNVGGMEYPGLNFCSFESKGEGLWGVTDHEFGHNWFPMIVGSNERRYAWMDEGFNTFINHYSTLAFNNTEYSSNLNTPRFMNRYLKWEKSQGINTYPDVSHPMNLGFVAYYKPAAGLIMLREYVIGAERFDNAFKSYIKTWAYKHPQPNDFFNHMEHVSGENLSWFWKGWFYGKNNIDIAVTDVKENKGDKGYVITLENKGQLPMPVKLEISFADGSSEIVQLPVEIWQRDNNHEFLLQTSKKVEKVVFDPLKQLTDVDDSNDTWPSSEKE